MHYALSRLAASVRVLAHALLLKGPSIQYVTLEEEGGPRRSHSL